MIIFVLFEESGRVRDAFRAAGHEAWSVDILPTRGDPTYHIRKDIWEILGWVESVADAVIAFPPCTKLCVSGNRYHAGTPGRQKALRDIRRLMAMKVPHIAIENPVGVISSEIRKPDQTIQPYQFGHSESKRTCLWLKGLPPLVPTEILTLPQTGRWSNQTPSGQNKLGPGPDRARLRAETYSGIAQAMADQWGPVITARS